MSQHDPTVNWQKAVHERQPDDDVLVPLTRFQAQKCAVIVDAVASGHDGYRAALTDICDFLQALALESGRIPARGAVPSAQVWERVDAWPWPLVGPPRPQPE
jgi:hypothetical protein